MTKLNHSSTDFTDYCVEFYSNKLECFMTKFNHSSTEFIDETLNQTFCWEEQDSHPITTKNKSSQSTLRAAAAGISTSLAGTFSVNEHTRRASRKAGEMFCHSDKHLLSLTQCRRVVLKLLLSVQSTPKSDYIRAENKVQSIPQAMKYCTQNIKPNLFQNIYHKNYSQQT